MKKIKLYCIHNTNPIYLPKHYSLVPADKNEPGQTDDGGIEYIVSDDISIGETKNGEIGVYCDNFFCDIIAGDNSPVLCTPNAMIALSRA